MPNWCSNHVTVTVDSDAEDAEDAEDTGDAEDAELASTSAVGQLSEFVAICANGNTELTFDGILPTPAELLDDAALNAMDANQKAELRSRVGATSSYAYHVTFWGCKWDASDVSCELDEDAEGLPTCVEYNFETPWGPPRGWAEAASERFPKLRLKLWYEEEGCDFAGELEYIAGEVVDFDEWEPSERRWLEDIVGCGYLQPGNSHGVVETMLELYEEQEEGIQLHQLYQRPRSDFEAAINASVDVADVLNDMAWGAGTEIQVTCVIALMSAAKLVWSPDRHRANFDIIGEGLKIAVRTVLLCAARRCQDDSKPLRHVPQEIWFKIFRSLRAVDYAPWGASDPFACPVSEDTTLRDVLLGAQ